jgi:formamidopyrimidine-DNA glycosylase
VDVAFPPRFTKLLVEFEGGMRLAFADPRRLGRIYLRSDPLHTSPIKDLAPDALLAPPSAAAFAAALQPLACAVKALLLDQNRVVSGVGNWIADEVCYQSRVHPGASCRSLDDAQLAAVHAALLDVVQTAVACGARSNQFPPSYLFHYRWSKGKKGELGGPRDAEGAAITFENVSGRTSAVVASRQFKGRRGGDASPSSKKKGTDPDAQTCVDCPAAQGRTGVAKLSTCVAHCSDDFLVPSAEVASPSAATLAAEKSQTAQTPARTKKKDEKLKRPVETGDGLMKKSKR